jgi:hypothetical protein
MARPFKGIDLDLVEKLASIHCTNKEIAAMVNCDPSLLSKKNYSAIIEKGKEKGKISLRRKMFETAMNGNVTLMIWLSKQYLGFTDKVEQTVDANVKTDTVHKTTWGASDSSDAK